MINTLSAPIVLQWEVTPTCNHNCIHCYNYWRTGPRLPKLPSDYNDLYTKIVDEIIRKKIFLVVVTGGEPLVVIREIAPYLRKLVENNVSVSMNSNLTLLTPRKAKLLKEIGIKSLLVSLPSGDPENCDRITNRKGSLSRIVHGIETAISYGFPIYTNMVVSHINLNDINVTARLVRDLGLTNFAVTRASKPVKDGWFSEQVLNVKEFRLMLDELCRVESEYGLEVDSLEANPACSFGDAHITRVNRFCTAGKTAATIGRGGEIRPCNRLPLVYGNIIDGFDPAWDSMDESRDSSWVPQQCSPCKLKTRCRGGCKADALVEYDDIHQPDPLCDLTTFPEMPREPINIEIGEIYKINPNIKFRKETFGFVAFLSTKSWLPITPGLYELLLSAGTISVDSLAQCLGVSKDDVRLTVGVLVKKKFLWPITNK